MIVVAVIGFLAFISLTLYSNEHKPKNTILAPHQGDITKATVSAQTILANAFQSAPTIIRIDKGPSNTWIFHTKIDGKTRKFYLLPDGQNLIEGTVISNSIKSFSNSIAERNNEESTKRTTLDSTALKGEFLAKVKQEINNDNTAKPETHDVQPKTSKQELPFKLPERNTILSSKDKALFFNRTEELEYIEVGSPDAPMVYVYFDFNCPGCRKAKEVLNKFTDTAQLRVRYIPVGVIQQESAIKAAYSIIPESNDDRLVLLDYFSQNKSAEELIQKKAPKDTVLKALGFISESNKTFMFTPKKLTPTFTFKLNNEVVIANLTSENSIKNMIERLKKQRMSL